MQVAVIGAGYVGLVTAAGLAGLGHAVRLAESDAAKLALLENGESPIFEPDLDDLIAAGVKDGLLTFHASNPSAVIGAEVAFIAVPTPQGPSGAADTTIVEQVVAEIAPHLEPAAVVALKSTTPTTSFRQLHSSLAERARGAVLVVNPEFLREGSAVHDFFHPDRILIGAEDELAVDRMSRLYEKIGAPLVVTDPVSAAIVKYASNAYLATRISFANAVANVCDAVGADVRDVLLGMGYDRRIGFQFFEPGPGFGGSCLPKDTQALVALAANGGYDFALLRGVIEVNEQQVQRILGRVRDALEASTDRGTVAVWGLAFKAGTDDIRESPAVRIASALVEEGVRVVAYDPKVGRSIAGIERSASPVEAAQDADVLLIATEWQEFRDVSLPAVRNAMRGRAVIDARNLLDPEAVRRCGLTYVGVGR